MIAVRAARSPAARAAEWDALVAATPGGDLVQASAWGDFKRTIGQDVRLVTVRDRWGALLGGAQMVLKRVAPGLALGSVPRGPLVVHAPAAGFVVERLVAVARCAGVRLLVVQAPEGGEAVERALEERGFSRGCPAIAPEATVRLDVRRTDEEILAGMRPKRRSRLRRPPADGLTFTAEEDVGAFASLYAATARRQGFQPLPEKVLRAQWDALVAVGACAILLARHRGCPVAGQWLTVFAGTVTTRLRGWDDEATRGSRDLRYVNERLDFEVMRWARARGGHTLDFGGIARGLAETLAGGGRLTDEAVNTPDHFKISMGGTPVVLPRSRWALTDPALATVLRPAVSRALRSPGSAAWARRFRGR